MKKGLKIKILDHILYRVQAPNMDSPKFIRVFALIYLNHIIVSIISAVPTPAPPLIAMSARF